MPVRRFRVGRAYTAHEIVEVSGLTGCEELAAAKKIIASAGYKSRIEESVAWARHLLAERGLPPDPQAAVYETEEWRQANERQSLEWYAREILAHATDLAIFVERGEAVLAADWALSLGELITEARMIWETIERARHGGREKAATSDAQAVVAARIALWQQRAAVLWKRHPDWKTAQVARRIDRDGYTVGHVRKKIKRD